MLLEFRALQKRTYRVDPKRAGRLYLTSSASAGDSYRLEDPGYAWQTHKVPFLHYLSAALGPFGFVKSDGFAGQGGDAICNASLIEEAASLPCGFPAALTPSGSFVPFTFWYALSDGLLWAASLLVAISFRQSLLGRTQREKQKRLSFYLSTLLACVAAVKVWSAVFPRVLALLGVRWPWLAALTNGAVLETRLKLFLLLSEALGALACFSLFLGQLHRSFAAFAVSCFLLRYVLRCSTRPAVLQHLVARPAAVDGDRAAVLPPSVADVELKLARAESTVQVQCSVVALALSVTVPKAAIAVLVLCLLTVHLLYVLRNVCASLVSYELNAPRAELCMTAFYAAERKAVALACDVAATNKSGAEEGTTSGAVPDAVTAAAKVNLSPALVSRWERPWVLPMSFGPFYPNDDSRTERVMHSIWTTLPSLKVNLRVGAALSSVLDNRVGLSTRNKQEVIQGVEGSLAMRGVALLYDEPKLTYYVILPETHTRDGHPSSWAPLRETAFLRQVGDPDAVARMRETPAEGPVWASPSRRLLWAYFYAYSHQQAASFLGSTATPPPIPPQPNPKDSGLPIDITIGYVKNGILRQSSSPTKPPIIVIEGLRADGVLDLREPKTEKTGNENGILDKADAVQDNAIREVDGLAPVYKRFVALLERQGWNLDRFLTVQEGFTVSIWYM